MQDFLPLLQAQDQLIGLTTEVGDSRRVAAQLIAAASTPAESKDGRTADASSIKAEYSAMTPEDAERNRYDSF